MPGDEVWNSQLFLERAYQKSARSYPLEAVTSSSSVLGGHSYPSVLQCWGGYPLKEVKRPAQTLSSAFPLATVLKLELPLGLPAS